MKNKFLRFTAFALVLTVCVAAAFMPASLASALGNFDPVEPPYDDPPVPEDFPYDDVYFFTNRYDAFDREQQTCRRAFFAIPRFV